MPRKRKKSADATEEISLQDTQEYIVANPEGRPDPGPEAEVEEPVENGQVTEVLKPEFEEAEPEFEEEVFEDEYEEDVSFYDDEIPEEEIEAIDLPRPDPGPREPTTPIPEQAAALWASLVAKVREVKLPDWPRGKPEAGGKAEPEGKTRPKETPGKADDGEGRGLDIDTKAAAAVAAIVLACLVVGIGAYLIGKGSGDDAGAASQEGETAGKQAGAIDGATKGYPAGFVKGRDKGFEKAYIRAYKVNYKRAFEQAGLDVPADEDIDVPEP